MTTPLRLSASLSLAALAMASVFAAPFTGGNLVALRFGPGQGTSGTLNNFPTPLALVELNPTTGAVVQEITLPSTGVDAVTGSGTATAEGQLTFNGGFFSFGGYNQAVGLGSNVVATTSLAVNRVLVRVDLNGNVSALDRIQDGFSAGAARAGVSIDGTSGYLAGNGNIVAGAPTGGIRYVVSGLNTSVLVTPTPTNLRVVDIYNGDLYFSTASAGFLGVYRIPGLPTTSGQTAEPVVTFDTSAGHSPYDFIFMDGGNTLYVVDDSNLNFGAYRYTKIDGVFTNRVKYDTGIPTAGPRSITGYDDPVTGNNILFVTTQAGIFRLEDTGLFPTWQSLTTAPTNNVYRGLAMVPAQQGGVRKISGTLAFGDGFVGSRDSSTPIEVQVFAAGDTTTPLFETVVNVDNTTFTYEINLPASVTASSVDVRIGGRQSTFLYTRVSGVALGAAGATGVDASLRNGNVDTDDSVTVFDYDELSAAFDSSVSGELFNPRADLDQDGTVTVFDYDILSSNFDQLDQP